MIALKKNIQKMSIQFNYNYPHMARQAGFRLRQYKDGPIDWRFLGAYEIDRILRDQNIEDIDKVLIQLSEAPLGSVLLDTNILDPAIAKYFIVSQFAIQYLLFCRNFLDETVQELRETHVETQLEIARLNKMLTEANNEILQLNKKMTQMEAIHEVIYPCHLCTKNFANNEALNIHIRRKHTNAKTVAELKTENNDLTLINTIKLELEIKQLKERLNNTEKEIKDRKRNCVYKNEDDLMIKTDTGTKTCNVAIQSNLSEEKEKSDHNVEGSEHNHITEKRMVELDKLQTKISKIEEWFETQMANNGESIAEINSKLNDITEALKQFSIGNKHPCTEKGIRESTDDQAIDCKHSVEDLECVLSEKLKEIVHNIKSNYQEKLNELECEVQKTQQEVRTRMDNIILPVLKNIERPCQKESIQPKVRKIRKTSDENQSDEEGDGTYNIEEDKQTEIKARKTTQIASQVSDNNQTFVKNLETDPKILKFQSITGNEESLSDNTNISESLSEDIKTPLNKGNENLVKPIKVEIEERMRGIQKTPSTAKSSRIFTRKDAKIIANKRLFKYGYDMGAKSVSSTTFKRLNIELNEKRTQQKQQYPNFYATRNRVKKFVDKICTTTENSESILTKTSMQPMKIPRLLKKQFSTDNEDKATTSDVDDEIRRDDAIKETRTKIASLDDFKKRLEQVLASPVQRSLGIKPTEITNLRWKTKIEGEPSQLGGDIQDDIPMPLPRKRVMFNTAIATHHSNTDKNEFAYF